MTIEDDAAADADERERFMDANRKFGRLITDDWRASYCSGHPYAVHVVLRHALRALKAEGAPRDPTAIADRAKAMIASLS